MMSIGVECDICQKKGCFSDDLMYRCLKCGVPAHQSNTTLLHASLCMFNPSFGSLFISIACYGGILVADDDDRPDPGHWTCEACSTSPDGSDTKCLLCPSRGHLLKPTGDGAWVHIVCVLYHQFVHFDDAANVADLTDLDKLDKDFFKLKCTVCAI